MRRRKKAIGCFCLLFAVIFLFAACGGEGEIFRQVQVVVHHDDTVVAEGAATGQQRGNIEVKLTIAEGYGFEGCDYAGDYIVSGYTGEITLRLLDVKYNTRVKIQTNTLDQAIYYHLNGGEFCDSFRQGDTYMGFADLSHHLRANTDIATGVIQRDGYTQIGWNTQPDGSGERIGLGSRVTKENGTLHLYAQWVEWTDGSAFTYEKDRVTEDQFDIVLTGYCGDQDISSLVIPGQIDGRTVVGISEDFAQGLQLQCLVLPNTTVYVRRDAFQDTTIEEIWFFDNLREVYDESFSTSIRTVHINAVQPPCFTVTRDHAQFAEVMDRLILNADKKKMVFFAGCSMGYGLDSETVEAAFDGEYVIINAGVIGGTNASFQFDCITEYMSEGDIFIHAPEGMSPYQLLEDLESEIRIFYCVESNYDLLALADLSETKMLFDHFTEFNQRRAQEEQTYTYQDYNPNYNEYGDYALERTTGEKRTSDIVDYFRPDYVNKRTVARLNEKYDRIAQKGATVFVSFAPINKDAIPEDERTARSWEQFERNINNGVDSRFRVISSVEDYMMDEIYFYDTDYHLTDEGAAIRTQRLINDIKAALAE